MAVQSALQTGTYRHHLKIHRLPLLCACHATNTSPFHRKRIISQRLLKDWNRNKYCILHWILAKGPTNRNLSLCQARWRSIERHFCWYSSTTTELLLPLLILLLLLHIHTHARTHERKCAHARARTHARSHGHTAICTPSCLSEILTKLCRWTYPVYFLL